MCLQPLWCSPDSRAQTCGHEFHLGCLEKWFAQDKTNCPLCRASLRSKLKPRRSFFLIGITALLFVLHVLILIKHTTGYTYFVAIRFLPDYTQACVMSKHVTCLEWDCEMRE